MGPFSTRIGVRGGPELDEGFHACTDCRPRARFAVCHSRYRGLGDHLTSARFASRIELLCDPTPRFSGTQTLRDAAATAAVYKV